MGNTTIWVANKAWWGWLALGWCWWLAVRWAVRWMHGLNHRCWPCTCYSGSIRNGARSVKWVSWDGCSGCQHGFPAPTLSAKASTDGYEHSEAHQGSKKGNLPTQVIFIYVSMDGCPYEQKVSQGRQPSAEDHDVFSYSYLRSSLSVSRCWSRLLFPGPRRAFWVPASFSPVRCPRFSKLAV